MIVSSIIPPARTGQTGQSGADAAAQMEPVLSRTLVPLQSVAQAAERYAARPSAPFMAHLIAMAEQAPQTRVLRRETPAIAQGAYGRATSKGADSFGRVVSQRV